MTSLATDLSNRRAALNAADCLCLAATPAFAIMALATGVYGEPSMAGMMMPDASPVAGMMPMYVLMSIFHAAPWLKLISQGRGYDATPETGE